MSTYEDYNQASHAYDNQRKAVGADEMAAMLQFYSGNTLQLLPGYAHLRCWLCRGTGNYLIEMGVRKMTILDASPEMLQHAKCKLHDYIARGIVRQVVEAKMPPIPFPDGSFDAIMFNVVLNHLDRENPKFPNSVYTLKESTRILRPNGLIIISAMLSTAFSRVVWFTQLNMDLTERFVTAVLPSVEQYEKMFEDAGLKCIQKLNILGSDIYKSYYNLDGPLDESWRATSSYWSFASKEEVDVAVQKVKSLKENGEFEKWVKDHDNTSNTGVLTIFFCKPRLTDLTD